MTRRHTVPKSTLYQVRRQQEVRDTLPHVVLVPAVPADELPLNHLRLHEERVQLLEHGLVALKVLRGGRLGGELWETQLFITRVGLASDSPVLALERDKRRLSSRTGKYSPLLMWS